MEPTWISLFAILLLEMFSYFLKAVYMMRILHLELALALESMNTNYFGFFYARRPYQGISYQCEEYSSSSGSWKRIGCVAHSPMSWRHVSINGTVYWFITSSEKEALYPSSILAVDMEETFRTIDLPKLVPEYSFLVELEGCLSLIALHVDNVHRFESFDI